MVKKFNDFYFPFLEKDEHKKSREYKKLNPKMRTAVDDIFKIMDIPINFLVRVILVFKFLKYYNPF